MDEHKETEKTVLEQTTAPVVIRGMRGMSSMGKPVNSRSVPATDPKSVLLGSVKMTTNSSPSANEFICTCATGWTGPTCEISK